MTSVRYPPNSNYATTGSIPAPASNPYKPNTIINSYHIGGINVLLTDGSVRYVNNNINFLTLEQLCVRNDGMVVGDY